MLNCLLVFDMGQSQVKTCSIASQMGYTTKGHMGLSKPIFALATGQCEAGVGASHWPVTFMYVESVLRLKITIMHSQEYFFSKK